MDNNNKNNKNNKNRSGWHIILISTLLSTFLFFALYSNMGTVQPEEISYDAFLKMVDEGEVEKVSIGTSKIYITSKADENAEEDPLTELFPEMAEEEKRVIIYVAIL